MTLREAGGPPGPPWDRELAGTLDRLTVESELLDGNPLGDPHRRPLYVLRPPGAAAPLPTVYLLQAFTGQLDKWLNRSSFEPTRIERLDAMFASGACAPALVVFVDAWTSLGGSQFVNSPATGPYLDYLCDEVVPFVDAHYPTLADRAHRGVAGHSSGGYGALIASMQRPDVFGACASLAGDALFEVGYLPTFPRAARALRDHFDGSPAQMLDALARADGFDYGVFGAALEMYACACAYSPDPERPTVGQLPFEIATGRLRDDVWARWLAHDPVRMIPERLDALRSLRRIHLEAGRRDEYFLDLAARAVADALSAGGVDHTLELFDGGHGGVDHRFPGLVRELVGGLG
jgi:enterochelin esterase-like enzyme